MHKKSKLDEAYTSTKDASNKKIAIKVEKHVCLNTSILMFSFLLSLIIDLYSFIPLTANANIHGINIIFCKNNVHILNKIPFQSVYVTIIDDNVYPKKKPLIPIITYTIGIPTTVEPINHINNANIKLLIIEFFSKLFVSIL